MDYYNNHNKDRPIPRKPDCFPDWNQWVDWCLLADLSFVSKSNFCLDCTENYQSRMILEGKCHYPTTFFKLWKGDVVGMCDAKVLRRKTSDFPVELGGPSARTSSRATPSGVRPPMEDDDGFD